MPFLMLVSVFLMHGVILLYCLTAFNVDK